MSRALRYLSKARPEAMGAYFDFLRANGEALEPKTRALISIITKVANETETGLKQYTQKALDQGVSADEILDALMMAFPALGLSKILWAVDILLEIGVLSSDEREAETAVPEWHPVGPTSGFEDDATRVVNVNGRDFFVSKSADSIRVFEAKCPHHETNLGYAPIINEQVECPLHGWRFRVNDGTCTRGGRDLLEFEAKIEDDVLLIYW